MKDKVKAEYFWLTIFALCFLAFQLVQDNTRPTYRGNNEIIIYLLGVAPNFFPAIGIPALFVVLIPMMNSKRLENIYLNEKSYVTANLISLTGLLSWEFIQIYTSMGHFDWHDVLWTIIGALLFHVLAYLFIKHYK